MNNGDRAIPRPRELQAAMEEAGAPITLRAAQAIVSGERGISAWRLALLGQVCPQWATWETVAGFAEKRAGRQTMAVA